MTNQIFNFYMQYNTIRSAIMVNDVWVQFNQEVKTTQLGVFLLLMKTDIHLSLEKNRFFGRSSSFTFFQRRGFDQVKLINLIGLSKTGQVSTVHSNSATLPRL